MKYWYDGLRTFAAVFLTGATLIEVSSLGAPNNWTNTTSALWRSATNWSLATAPDSTSDVDPTLITNAGTKTVTIDSATDSGNLSIRSLTLSAPPGATNILALVDVPQATPLTTSNALLISNRGTLAITNSAVNATADFDVVGGNLILQSSSLICGLNCDLQSGNILVNSGSLTATAGTTGIRLGRFSGANANLIINGGTVNTLRITLGSVSGSQNSLSVSGGSLICLDSFSAAQLPATTGNVLLTGGNLIVTNGTAKIADRAAATFTQTGGSAHFADLRIGDLGVGTYNLSSGSFVITPHTTNDLCIIGNMENADFNQSGGVTVISEELHVADFSGVTANVNLTGGAFFATNDLVAIGREGSGTLTISNALMVLTNTSVARHPGASGTLNVQRGANVYLVADLSIGRLAGASGQVFVAGGLLSLTNDDVWVGRGGSGELTISDGAVRAKNLLVGSSDDGTNAPSGTLTITGGTAELSSGFFLGTSGLSTGAVTMAAGSLCITNDSSSANLVISSGGFTLNGGTVVADLVQITNDAGQLTLNNGLLRAKAMNVANGQPFIVGDGVNPATLELLGGTYTFANGLVISLNAVVTGCGTIIGTVSNNGTYINPCGNLPPPTSVSALSKSGSTAALSCASQTGFSYTLEYKNSLGDAAWTPVLPATPGTGNVLNLLDTAATNSTRFYRVRVQ